MATLTPLWPLILTQAYLFHLLLSRCDTATPSPLLIISGMGHANGMKPILPPYSPAPLIGLLYPCLFRHIHHRQSYRGSYNRTVDLLQMDPNIIHEQLALQMQIYAFNNGAMVCNTALNTLTDEKCVQWWEMWGYRRVNDESPVCEKARQHFYQIKTMIEREVEMKKRNREEDETQESRQTEREGSNDSKLKKTRMGILVALN
ncbi:hypothetical protein V8E53_001275 [Lactarius tabidus]